MSPERESFVERLRTNLPEALHQLRQWVVWRMETRNNKPTKVPYSAVRHTKAKVTNPDTWSNFEQACQAYLQRREYAGVGFVFTEQDPFVGVDFDQCVTEGVIRPDILEHIQRFNSYTELSQSGTGVHIIVQGRLPAGGRKSAEHRIELYASARFFVMTGHHLPSTPPDIREAQMALDDFHATIFAALGQGALPTDTTGWSADDRAVLQRMLASKQGERIRALWQGDTTAHRHDDSAADLALCNHLTFWAKGNAEQMDRLFRRSGLMRPKWDEGARQGETYGQGTIRSALTPQNRDRITPPPHANELLPSGEQVASDVPVISVNHRQLAEVTTDGLAALIRLNQTQPTSPIIYVRGGMLVRVKQDENGEYMVQPLSEGAARGALARAAWWMKTTTDSNGQRSSLSTFPPTAVVRDLLNLPDWPGLPKLLGLVHCPTFAANGELHATYGYHPVTHLFNVCHLALDAVQITPDRVEAAKRFLLNELLGDFPFDSLASRAHAVALTLLPFVRPLIEGPTPIHAIDAPTPGTGKGLLANACSYAGRGHDLAATPAAQDDNEWRKRLTAVLLRADTHILIDNINQPLDSASLAAALTQPVWADRLLGQTCSLSLPINQIWIATGNNLITSDEIARRCIRIRLDANVERPDQRQQFRHQNLMLWVRQQRLTLIRAAVTLILAWVEAGMPRFTNHRKGSYEQWTEVMGGILQTAGIEGFLANEHEMYDTATAESARLLEFVEGWYQRYGSQPALVKDLFPLASWPDGPIPPAEQGLWRSLLEDALGNGTEHSRRTKLGRLLELNKDKIIAGYKVLKHLEDKKRPRFSLQKL